MEFEAFELRLTPPERSLFGRESLATMRHPALGYGWVLNLAKNGIAAGDFIKVRKNPRFRQENADGITDNRRRLHALTDLYDEGHALRLHRRSNEVEADRLERTEVMLDSMLGGLSDWRDWSDAKRLRYARAVDTISLENWRVVDLAKRQARDRLAAVAGLTGRLGDAHEHLAEALMRFQDRHARVGAQTSTRQERQWRLEEQRAHESAVVDALFGQGGAAAPGEMEQRFSRLAGDLRFKPAILTVNNATHQADVRGVLDWVQLRRSMTVFDKFYGVLAGPLNMLGAETVTSMVGDIDATVAGYSRLLEDYLDVLDLAAVGGDHDVVLDTLRDHVLEAEEQLFEAADYPDRAAGSFRAARNTARRARFYLRYRCESGDAPPPQWYRSGR